MTREEDLNRLYRTMLENLPLARDRVLWISMHRELAKGPIDEMIKKLKKQTSQKKVTKKVS